jgi:hypothetical protein
MEDCLTKQMEYTVTATVNTSTNKFVRVNYQTNRKLLNNAMVRRFRKEYPDIVKIHNVCIESNVNRPYYCVIYNM